MQRVKFIHAADIHLGSMIHYSGQVPEEISYLFKKATFNVFSRICDEAIINKVDFLLLAGDVYDREARSVVANEFFNQQCQRLFKEGISVYMIGGNHDPYREKGELLNLPENVYLFNSKEVGIEKALNKKGEAIARVLGQSYQNRAESKKIYNDYQVADEAIWNIGLLHSQLNRQSKNYVPCSLEDLKAKNSIHYWALGHIHQTKVWQSSQQVIAYPGIPQGRDMGETGIGGVLLVELVPQEKAIIKYIPTSNIVLKRVEVVIDEDVVNFIDLVDLILQKAELILKVGPCLPEDLRSANSNWFAVLKGYIIQWILVGKGDFSNLLEEQGEEGIQFIVDSLREKLADKEPFIWTDSVLDHTCKPFFYQENEPVVKEIDEVIDSLQNNQKIRDNLIGSFGKIWSDQVDHELIDEKRFQLDDTTLEMIVKQAKQLVLEELLGRREDK